MKLWKPYSTSMLGKPYEIIPWSSAISNESANPNDFSEGMFVVIFSEWTENIMESIRLSAPVVKYYKWPKKGVFGKVFCCTTLDALRGHQKLLLERRHRRESGLSRAFSILDTVPLQRNKQEKMGLFWKFSKMQATVERQT